MGVVHEAEDTRLDRRVALKMLTAVEGLAQDSMAWDRFRREARALARIDHPGVVTLYDIGVHEGTPYLVMQVLDGMSLADLASGRGAAAGQGGQHRRVRHRGGAGGRAHGRGAAP